jgi:hypothetical protein
MALVACSAAPSTAPAPAPAACEDVPTLTAGDKWLLLSTVVHVRVDLHGRGSLRGTAQLRIQLPRAPPKELRLNCAPTCTIHACSIDGQTLTTDDGRAAPPPLAPRASPLVEAIVPAAWRHTRDLVSYQRCHGAAMFVGSHQRWPEPGSGGYHAGARARTRRRASSRPSGRSLWH